MKLTVLLAQFFQPSIHCIVEADLEQKNCACELLTPSTLFVLKHVCVLQAPTVQKTASEAKQFRILPRPPLEHSRFQIHIWFFFPHRI